ncbi:MAG: serine/threonine-protein phosphatase [Planctomycetales bacterium]|nr:serine/threonine-protein phosphatase [Planctomycetales bacterium]
MVDHSPHPSQVLFDAQDEQPRSIGFPGGEVALFSRRSPGKETGNQDAAGIFPLTPTTGILMVADGCGGMTGGQIAARFAVEAMQEVVRQSAGSELPPRAIILDGFEKANESIRELGTGAATTTAIVEVDATGPTIRPYHAGDSSILLVGSRGKVKLLTRSHSPVGYAVEAGVISAEEAIYHEQLHLVSNVLGSEDTHIEVGAQRLMAARDTLLIASDGVFDNLHLDEVVALIRKGSLPQAARSLADAALQRMENPSSSQPSKPDDLTFILYRRAPQ